jgi:aminoglycoside 6-adenylyltransferase
MRNEQEMMSLIIGIAEKDERIRAVYMNGSRTNSNVEKDNYQDYDIVFVVTETISFLNDKNWINLFGEIAIVQEPDWNDIKTGIGSGKHDFSRRYAWLMLFKDGNRIDLGIEIKEEAQKNYLTDKMTVLLLDKDGFLPKIPPPTDKEYYVKKPDKDKYIACCNEFWWCLNNVAKGIARDELPYAMEMFNIYIRSMLNQMIDWYIGTLNNFSVNTGKMGKFYKKYLPINIYNLYYKTYSDGNYNNFWDSIFIACKLFKLIALNVGKYFNFEYNQNEENAMTEYLKQVKKDLRNDVRQTCT